MKEQRFVEPDHADAVNQELRFKNSKALWYYVYARSGWIIKADYHLRSE